jgi:hypothetical protein
VALLEQDAYELAVKRTMEPWHRGDADWTDPARRIIYVAAGITKHEAAQVIGHEISHHRWPGDQHRERFFAKVQTLFTNESTTESTG